MPVKIRFRSDSAFKADDTARRARGEKTMWFHEPELLEEPVPPAEPGDIWRIRWGGQPDGVEGPIAGYDICCIKCKQNHGWTTALNCSSKRQLPEWEFTDPETGAKRMVAGGFTCDHSGKSSCWTWTGTAEDGTLTASPSLHCLADRGGCGYHGWLQNGILSDG